MDPRGQAGMEAGEREGEGGGGCCEAPADIKERHTVHKLESVSVRTRIEIKAVISDELRVERT